MILDHNRLPYKDWVVREALNIKSDKCTFALDIHAWCCYEHDLGCSYQKDPRNAFTHYLAASVGLGPADVSAWTLAIPITRREADARFRRCLQKHSKLGRFSPMSWWRWLGVRIGAVL